MGAARLLDLNTVPICWSSPKLLLVLFGLLCNLVLTGLVTGLAGAVGLSDEQAVALALLLVATVALGNALLLLICHAFPPFEVLSADYRRLLHGMPPKLIVSSIGNPPNLAAGSDWGTMQTIP